jgi:hypothetical protein
VEQPQPHTTGPGDLDQRQLGPVQRPVGGEVAAVLVAVGVAEHHLLRVPATGDQRPVERVVEHRGERRAGRLQVLDRLEQRRDAHAAPRPAVGVQPEQADLLEQDGDLEDVADRFAHADHVVRDGLGAEQLHLRGRGHQQVELAAGQVGQLGVPAHPTDGAAAARR